MDILIHVPEYLLACTDQLVREQRYPTRCSLISKAVKFYLQHRHPEVFVNGNDDDLNPGRGSSKCESCGSYRRASELEIMSEPTDKGFIDRIICHQCLKEFTC